MFLNRAVCLLRSKEKIIFVLRNLIATSVLVNFLIYSGGTVILKSISLILMPFVLQVLSPAEYGLLSLATSFTSIFAVFSGLGLRQTFGIEFFHCDSAQRRIMANEIITIYLIIASPLFFALLANLPLLNRYVFLNTASITLLIVCLIYCFIQFFVELFYQLLRYQCKALQLTVLQVTVALCTIALNLFFLYRFTWSVTGMMVGYVLGMLIACAAGLHAYIRTNCFAHLDIKHSLKKCSYYLRLGLPFVPGMLFNWILAAGDKWILACYANLHDVGIYSLADTFGQVYQMLILYPMAGSYLPYLFNQFAANKNDLRSVEHQNRRLMYISMISMVVIITIGFIVGKPVLYYFLPAKYQQAIRYIWLILIGYIFLMGTYFTSALVQFHKKTFFLAFSLLAPAALNIGLNILLIPCWGIYGCISATLIAYIVYFASMFWYNNRLLSYDGRSEIFLK